MPIEEIIGLTLTIILTLGLLALFVFWKDYKARKNWKKLGENFDFEIELNSPTEAIFGNGVKLAKGLVEGYTVRCDAIQLGSTAASFYARCQFDLNHEVEDRLFTFYHATIFSKVERALGVQDVKMGNPTFDKEYMVSATNDELVKKIFTPQLQELVLRKCPPKGYFWIEKNKVRFETSYNDMSSDKNYQELISGIEICLHLAQELDKHLA